MMDDDGGDALLGPFNNLFFSSAGTVRPEEAWKVYLDFFYRTVATITAGRAFYTGEQTISGHCLLFERI